MASDDLQDLPFFCFQSEVEFHSAVNRLIRLSPTFDQVGPDSFVSLVILCWQNTLYRTRAVFRRFLLTDFHHHMFFSFQLEHKVFSAVVSTNCSSDQESVPSFPNNEFLR